MGPTRVRGFRQLGDPLFSLPLTARLGLGDRHVAGGAAFSPLSIPGLVTWLDFGDITTLFTDSSRTTPVTVDGNVVGGVTDKSGNGNHLVQTGANGLKPLYKTGIQNGNSVARFDGIDDYLKKSFTLTRPCTVYIAVKMLSFTHNDSIFDGGVGTNQVRFYQQTTDGRYQLEGQGGKLVNGVGGIASGNPMIVRCIIDTGAAASSITYNGGVAITGDTGIADPGGLMLGSSGTPGQYGNGDYFEALVFSSAIIGSTHTTIRDYLNSKWSIY